MRNVFIAFILFFSINVGFAQQQYADSLKQTFSSARDESSKAGALILLSNYYSGLYPDSGVYYADKIIELSTQNKYEYGKALGFLYKGHAIQKQGDFTSAIQLGFKSLNLSKELDEHRLYMLSRSNRLIGETYAVSGNAEKAVNFLLKSIDLQKQSGEYSDDFYKVYFTLAFTMLMQDKQDSAFFFLKEGWHIFSTSENKRNIEPWIVSGNVNRFSGNSQKAEEYFRMGIKMSKQYNSLFFVAAISNDMGGLFYERGMRDSCLHYLHQCLSLSQKYHYKVFEMSSSSFLSFLYDSLNTDSTLKYLRIYNAARDEVFGQEKIKQFHAASFEEEKKERDIEDARTKYENRLKLYGVIGAAVAFLVIAFTLLRSNRHKQKANKLLTQQKEKVETTLAELKATQKQLIQSEKMASLGELTAGIAHEIQNPLNFVNNFSDINKELLAEMRDELNKGNLDDAKMIAKDVTDNEEKINHHGKRADAIVKGMLQHSRSSTGQKEPTDINALADEYLRLAYHGLRAKDKSFNATTKTDFDNNVGKVTVVPQDLGRVILNLINNAFYAVDEKKKHASTLRQTQDAALNGYEPIVAVSTRRNNGKVEINVKDNGNGIPQKVLDKIFQPFFTTKPTGEGTGLGLSLAYDIVKAHGGELKVETTEGEGSKFMICIPA